MWAEKLNPPQKLILKNKENLFLGITNFFIFFVISRKYVKFVTKKYNDMQSRNFE